MTTQSKSILVPFLIVAGLIFAVALGWKLIGNDDTNTTPVRETVADVEEPKKVKPEKKSTVPEIAVVDYDKPKLIVDPMQMTEEERAERKKQASDSMSYALRLKTVDKAINELKSLREIGDNESAQRLINFINHQFPNESIPKELLD